MSPLRSRLGNIRPAHARTSTRNTPERASLPPVRPPEDHDATPKISFVARARHLTLTLPRSPSLGLECDPPLLALYLARPVYPRAFEHGTSQRKGCSFEPDYTRAGKHPASSWGWCDVRRRNRRRPPPLSSLRSCFSLACCSLCFRFSCVRRRWFVLSTCGGGSCAEETGACAAFSLFFFMAAAYGPLMCPVYGCLSTPIL